MRSIMQPTRRDFLHLSTHTGAALLLPAAWSWGQAPADPPQPASPFLRGNFAPVREEVVAENLRIIGRLPAGLEGMYVRNGPNPQFPPRGNYHWFDGDGMLHGVRIAGGRASYRNRYIRTAGFEEERRAGRALYNGLADPPDLARIIAGQNPNKNVANTALIRHNGRLLALWEGGEPHEIRTPGLETVGPHTFGGQLRHPFTAHPKIDPATGEMLCFGYQPVRPFVRFSTINARGEIVRTVPVDIPRPVMMHDFAITQRFAVFMDLPETFDLARMLRRESPLVFRPEHGARFGLVPRQADGGPVRWFDSQVCFVFHTLAAWEEDDAVILIACRYREFPDEINGGPANPNARPNQPVLYRWRFDLRTGRTSESALDDLPVEFPRIHEARMAQPIRYGYTAVVGGEMFTGYRKYDLQRGQHATHQLGAGRFGGEAVFVPRPDARAEDDGWLVAMVHDVAEGRAELIVLDARDLAAQPVARILLPVRVPYGFHGIWIDGAQL
jgi:carotenoid cleavage dioxygenase-like enzyme